MVFEFKEPIDTALEYHVWQAKLTVSANGRVATMTSMPYNMGLKARVHNHMLLSCSRERARHHFLNPGHSGRYLYNRDGYLWGIKELIARI